MDWVPKKRPHDLVRHAASTASEVVELIGQMLDTKGSLQAQKTKLMQAIGKVADVEAVYCPDSDASRPAGTQGQALDAWDCSAATSDDIVSVSFAVDGAVGTMLLHTAALDGNVDLLTFRGTDGTLVIDRSLKLYLGKRDGQLKEYKTQLPSFVPNRFRASGYAAGTVLLGRAIVTALAKNDAGALASAATIADGAEVQRLLDRVRAVADMAAPR